MKKAINIAILLTVTVGVGWGQIQTGKAPYIYAPPNKGSIQVMDESSPLVFYIPTHPSEYLRVPKEYQSSVLVESTYGTAVRLGDDEYTHLQSLRKAVVDEEMRLAVKYGANMCINGGNYPKEDGSVRTYWQCPGSDKYEYHGQLLLIEKGK